MRSVFVYNFFLNANQNEPDEDDDFLCFFADIATAHRARIRMKIKRSFMVLKIWKV